VTGEKAEGIGRVEELATAAHSLLVAFNISEVK